MHRRSARARRIYTCGSGRNKLPHRSALALRRRPCRWVASTALMFGVARKLTLRASGGSNTPSRRSRRSARARRIYACSSSRNKLPHRSALCIRRRPCRWISVRFNMLMFGVARKLTFRALGGSNTPIRRSRRSARARRIYACSSSRKKRPHRSALCTAAVRCVTFLCSRLFCRPLNVI